MLYIYTENLFLYSKIKNFVKFLFGKKTRGPQAVEESLVLGLAELGVDFKVNRKIEDSCETSCVLNGEKTLRWAIRQKKLGKIKKLVAGPNVAVTPLDSNGLIMSPEIDKYLVPAQWSVNWWTTFNAEWAKKLDVWPAGVRDEGNLKNENGIALIFQKNAPEELLGQIGQILLKQGIKFRVISYGKFDRKEYFNLLQKSKYMIYLSQSESQGLALHEAWMANVPTLVWNRGFMEYKDYRWEDEKISAPYLSPETGMFFSGENDFEQKLRAFLDGYKSFRPREFSLKNFTNKISAQKFLQIIKTDEY